MSEVKVSIVVPVYNPGKLLHKCLGSARNQTLEDIEVICVDDGSTDGSLDLLNEYAGNDSRFKVFSQENKGAGSARNLGIREAKGEYLLFLDADDWIKLDACQELYILAKSLDSDLVLFDNIWHQDDGDREFIHYAEGDIRGNWKSLVYDYRRVKDKVFSGYFGVIWTKFYRTDFLKRNNLSFPSHKLYNDVEFHIKSLVLAERISYCPKIFYHYQNFSHDSLQKSYRDKKEAMVFYDVVIGIKDFLIERNLLDEFRYDFLKYVFRHFKEKLEEVEEDYRNEYFLKIKGFFESILLDAEDFDEIYYYALPHYVHMIDSKDYEEYRLRTELFDDENFNPSYYSSEEFFSDAGIMDVLLSSLQVDDVESSSLHMGGVKSSSLQVDDVESSSLQVDGELTDLNKMNVEINSMKLTEFNERELQSYEMNLYKDYILNLENRLNYKINESASNSKKFSQISSKKDERIDELDSSLKSSLNRINHLNDDLEKSRLENNRLEEDKVGLNEEISSLNAEITQLMQNNESLNDEVSNLKMRIDDLERENEVLSRRLINRIGMFLKK